jgi:acyl carrier protein
MNGLSKVALVVRRNNILDRTNSIVSKQLNINKPFPSSSRFTEDLGADSLDRVELAMALESEFGRPISDTHANKLNTVKSIVDYMTIGNHKRNR